MMRGSVKILTCVLAGLMLCIEGYAVIADSSPAQYKGITDRNVFALKPVPPKIIDEPPALPLPKITLKGITTVLGRNLAIMKVLFPGKPGEPAKEESYMLAQGQRDGNIEVLEVNEQAGTVKVNNFGTVMTLTFEKETVKPVTPGPGGLPNQAGASPSPNARGANPLTPTGNFNTGKRVFANPPLPFPTVPIPAPTNTSSATLLPAVASTPLTNAQPQTAAQEKALTPEEQVVLRELEREAARQQLEKSVVPGTPASAPPPTAPAPPATELAPQ